MRPDVIVRVVPFVDQFVELPDGVSLLESPQLVLDRLYLALHVGILFRSVGMAEVVCNEHLLGRLIEVAQKLASVVGLQDYEGEGHELCKLF